MAAAAVSATLSTACVAPLLEPFEESLIYRPRGVDAEDLKLLSSAQNYIEEVRLPTRDGLTLHGWLKRPDHWQPGERHPLVIVYGGVRQEVSGFVKRARSGGPWGWLVINYRGFGLSQGSPSERRVVDDAKRIYDWAALRPDVDASNIVVLGRSLGSFVAVSVAASRKVRAAILATPFDSVTSLGEQLLRGLPIAWLVQDHYNSSLMAPSISVPALFVLAEKDDVTPAKNGMALARIWGGSTKTVMLHGAGHEGIELREEFWSSVGEFLAAMNPQASSSAAAGSSRDRSSVR